MSRYDSRDIAKGHMVTPSHVPMPGVEERPIDAGIPESEHKDESRRKKGKDPKPGISPSLRRDHLF